MSPRRRLRELVSNRGYLIAPGAHDTLTARLVQLAGFDAVYPTGGGFSRSCGCPDLGLPTLTEMVQFLGRTVEAVDARRLNEIERTFPRDV